MIPLWIIRETYGCNNESVYRSRRDVASYGHANTRTSEGVEGCVFGGARIIAAVLDRCRRCNTGRVDMAEASLNSRPRAPRLPKEKHKRSGAVDGCKTAHTMTGRCTADYGTCGILTRLNAQLMARHQHCRGRRCSESLRAASEVRNRISVRCAKCRSFAMAAVQRIGSIRIASRQRDRI